MPTNVLGTELKCCCRDPMTGFYRDGFCRTGPEDLGLHTVCVKVTQEFLDRKSTRLNSSHSQISYAVFCLKKKKITDVHVRGQRGESMRARRSRYHAHNEVHG